MTFKRFGETKEEKQPEQKTILLPKEKKYNKKIKPKIIYFSSIIMLWICLITIYFLYFHRISPEVYYLKKESIENILAESSTSSITDAAPSELPHNVITREQTSDQLGGRSNIFFPVSSPEKISSKITPTIKQRNNIQSKKNLEATSPAEVKFSTSKSTGITNAPPELQPAKETLPLAPEEIYQKALSIYRQGRVNQSIGNHLQAEECFREVLELLNGYKDPSSVELKNATKEKLKTFYTPYQKP